MALHSSAPGALRRLVFTVIACATCIACGAAAQGADGQMPALYTVNGQAAPIELQQMFYLYGLPPGAYYVDEVGDFGQVGQPPLMNIQGGPALGTGSGQPLQMPQGQGSGPNPPVQAPPQWPGAPGGGSPGAEAPGAVGVPPAGSLPPPAPAPPPPAPAYGDGADGVTGSRIFWVYSPSIFSDARGGSSGYIHLCPGGVFWRSTEGSFSVGGDYDAEYGANDGWAGGAHVARSGGRWTVQGPDVVLRNGDGSTQTFDMASLQRGSWTWGRTKYAVERGRASCQ